MLSKGDFMTQRAYPAGRYEGIYYLEGPKHRSEQG